MAFLRLNNSPNTNITLECVILKETDICKILAALPSFQSGTHTITVPYFDSTSTTSVTAIDQTGTTLTKTVAQWYSYATSTKHWTITIDGISNQ